MLCSWNEVVSKIRKDDNMIWKDFTDQVIPQIKQQLKEKSVEPSDEEINKALTGIFLSAKHPVYNFAHVYKCDHCEDYHVNLVTALLTEASLNSEDNLIKNGRLAFELTENDLDERVSFMMSDIYPELHVITVTVNGERYTAFTLKENIEIVEAEFLRPSSTHTHLH